METQGFEIQHKRILEGWIYKVEGNNLKIAKTLFGKFWVLEMQNK